MKSFYRTLLISIIICFAFSSINMAQQLLQSFIEINNSGSTGLGQSVSNAGDVNGDGFDDVIVGAPGYNLSAGRAYIYYGGNTMNSTPDVTMTGEGMNDQFGFSVSGAGDVNGDNYADVIVGAPYYNTSIGRAYIYYGGSSMSSSPTADITMTGEGANNNFGYSVSGAGDVNGDTYADVIVGAPSYSLNTGRAYIYYGSSSMSSTPTADVTMTGEGISNGLGYSVSGAGDVNGDNYTDVIVGAIGYSSGTGRAYIYYGGSSMDNTADVTMTGEGTNDNFGYSVSGAGDINGDTYADVIVGAFGYNSNTGKAYIYYGSSSMSSAPTADVTMTGEATNDHFGSSVSAAGDVNGDTYADVIVGASGYNASTGRVYIYYGSSSMSSTPTADVTMTGEGMGVRLGNSVSAAGDVNGDTYADVIVGSGYYSGNSRAYIFYGSSSMSSTPTADVTMTGEGTSNNFGYSVSGAGDVNGDGYADVIVGASGYNASTGGAYIYYGGSSMDNTADVTLTVEGTNDFGYSVSGAGDVNGDGYADVIVGAPGYSSSKGRAYIFYGSGSMSSTSTADVTMTGEGNFNYFGSSVSGAGDVNKDGYDDVIVGANGYSSYTGRAYIYYGSSSMSSTPTADVTMTGEATNDQFGHSVSAAGDVNGDTYADVIVGAPGYASQTGRAYIYFGSSSMDNAADVKLTTGAGDFFGWSVSGAGDVNGDTYDDVIVGAKEYNTLTGRAYIYFGSSSMSSFPIADVTMTGEDISDQFGWSVSGAGDVNGDTYDDVIVGAPIYSSSTGRVYIYYGSSSMSSTPTADVTMTGEGANNYFGWSVSGAGDVNGDNYADVIVGAYGYPLNGKAYIYKDNSAVFVTAKLKIFLEGPYAGSSTMSTVLNSSLPTNDPYSLGENVSSIPSTDIVDWVKVELRTGASPSEATTVMATRAAFIKSDGSIVDLDGTSDIKFSGVSDGDYYVVIMHRNHLAVMSAGTVALSSSGSTLYDFTTGSGQFYGSSTGAKDLGSGVWGMIAGDGNGNGQVQNNDSESIWKPDNGTSGYKNSDFNMNGQVQNNDNENYWKPNNGRGSQVP